MTCLFPVPGRPMFAPFTTEDRTFLAAILNHPADLTGWLAYADWLDEHDQPNRAEFLRLQVRREELPPDDADRPAVEARLRELREIVHPDWVAVFDRPPIENCGEFAFQCPKRWESLKVVGDDPTIRHCESCNQSVYYCRDMAEAREHASEGRCVAVSLGVPRYPNDLHGDPEAEADHVAAMLLGLPEEKDTPVERTPMLMGRMALRPDPPPRRPWWRFW